MIRKILFIGPTPPPLGGVSVINQSLQGLNYKGRYEPVACDTSKGAENEDLYARKGISNIIHMLGSIIRAYRYIRVPEICIVNIFVTSNISFLRDAILIILAKLHKKRVIVHFHSKKSGEFFLNRFTIIFVSIIFRMVNKIIVLSPDHLTYFSKFFKKDKMIVLENFIDTKAYDCDIQRKENEFLYVGRLSERKGFFDLLAAVKQLKVSGYSPLMHIIGVSDNDSTMKDIDEQIEKDSTLGQFVFHGYRYGEEKFRLFRRCKFLVFPSHFENSPVVLKEAMAANMIIVSTKLASNENVLLDYPNVIYISPGEPDSLGTGIRLAIDAKVSDCRAFQSYSTKRFDVKTASERFIEILDSVS